MQFTLSTGHLGLFEKDQKQATGWAILAPFSTNHRNGALQESATI
jgi:hypothetical protein